MFLKKTAYAMTVSAALAFLPFAALAAQSAPSKCVAVIPVTASMGLGSKYVGGTEDQSHSKVDPALDAAYKKAMAPFRDELRNIVKLADKYGRGKSANSKKATLECLVTHLKSLSAVQAMTIPTTPQDYVVQGWIAGGVATSYLKAQDELELRSDLSDFKNWIRTVTNSVITYYNETDPDKPHPGPRGARNNHRYWAGFTAASVGLVLDDQNMKNFAIEALKIGTSQVTPEGTLPLEIYRKPKALQYHEFSLRPMVAIASLLDTPELDLFHLDNKAIERLAGAIADSLLDPDGGIIAKEAGIKQEPVKTKTGLAMVLSHVDDPDLAAKITSIIGDKAHLDRYLGGNVDFYDDNAD